MATVPIRDINVHYQHGGNGPRLLFLNGSGATLAGLEPVLAQFRERFELLAHDQRGLGLTSVPSGTPTMADFAADALALADHVGWHRFRVLGLSFGGMVAQELAVSAPERVERLALLCTSPGGAGGSSYPLHELAPGEAPSTLYDTRFTNEWLAEHPGDATLAELVTAGSSTPRSHGAELQLEARRHHDVWDRLDRIRCPTLVAAGRWDGIAPLANSEAITARVHDAELRVYDGGHIFFLQDPKAFPDAMDFLEA